MQRQQLNLDDSGRSGKSYKVFVLMRQAISSNVYIPSSEIDTDIDRPSRWLMYILALFSEFLVSNLVSFI